MTDLSFKKIITITGHLFFVVYSIFCVYYYLERTLLFDGAFYCFKMIHFRSLNIENGRWGAFYTQLLPLCGLFLGCKLKTFLLLFSLSFGLCNYIFFILFNHLFKKPGIALAYLFTLLFGYKHSFFYPVSEIHSTIPLLFMFMALLDKYSKLTGITGKKNWGITLLIFVVIIWIAKTHVLSVIPLFYILFYILISDGKNFRGYFIFGSVAALIYMTLFLLIPKGSYESEKMVSFDSFMKVLYDPVHCYGFLFFKGEFSRNYYLVAFIFLLTFVYLLWRKEYLKISILSFFLIGFWLLILAKTQPPDGLFGHQNYYCYLGLFIAIPFGNEVIRYWKPVFFTIAILFIFTFSYYKIVKAGLRFTDRKDYQLRCIKNLKAYNNSKFILSEDCFFQETMCSWWNFSFESLLLSSVDSPDHSTTFYVGGKNNKLDSLSQTDKNIFVGVEFAPDWFNLNQVNSQPYYFYLKDCCYKKVNTLQENVFYDTIFNSRTIKIELDKKYCILKNEFRIIPVTIKNLTSFNLPSQISHAKKIRLSYHLKDLSGNIFKFEGYRSSLEMDVHPLSQLETGLVIELHDVPRGRYELIVDLVHENKRWFNINSSSLLTIY